MLQAEQLGTGHAVRIALEAVPEAAGTVVVINGDVPLLRAETVAALVAAHEGAGAAATVLAAEVPDPTGLGRIVRDARRRLERIVEERDATPAQRALREINAGIYAFDAARLRAALGKLSTDNDQGEEYLTDVFGLLVVGRSSRSACTWRPTTSRRWAATTGSSWPGCAGCCATGSTTAWMRTGVTILDPATTWIDVTVTVGRDAVIDQNTQLRGATSVGAGRWSGRTRRLIDTAVGARRDGGAQPRGGRRGRARARASARSPTCGRRRGWPSKAKVGTFVETKNSERRARARRCRTCRTWGTRRSGRRPNIGAATIFVNYDGVHKHRTTVGEARVHRLRHHA